MLVSSVRFRRGGFFSSLVLVLFVAAGGLGFGGCDAEGGNKPSFDIPMPGALKGVWESTYGEIYEIGVDKFVSKYAGEVSYAGDMVNVRQDGNAADAGYLTIRYTVNSYSPAAVGKYYVIYYSHLDGSSVRIAGASDGAGKETRAEAEAVYTVMDGYFSGYSSCSPAAGGN